MERRLQTGELPLWYESKRKRRCHRLDPVAGSQFPHGVLHVKNDSSFTDLKNLGNLPVSLSLFRPDQNLLFPIGQGNGSKWNLKEDLG
jgi:hypothetical protein